MIALLKKTFSTWSILFLNIIPICFGFSRLFSLRFLVDLVHIVQWISRFCVQKSRKNWRAGSQGISGISHNHGSVEKLHPKWKETNMDVSKNSGTPKSSILMSFHYKPSILGYPYFGNTYIGGTHFHEKPWFWEEGYRWNVCMSSAVYLLQHVPSKSFKGWLSLEENR